MDLHNLIETIGTSVSRAQESLERHSLQRFFDYFHKPDGAMNSLDDADSELQESASVSPKTAKVELPCSDNIEKTAQVEIPLVALVHHRQVHLDKVTVRVRTRLSSDGGGRVMADINAPIFNAANALEESESASNDDADELELVFNVTESAEGLSRVVQNLLKTI